MSDSQANPWFRDWIEGGRELALANGLRWDFPLGSAGRAANADSWNVSVACGAPAIPAHRLNDFGYDTEALRVINGRFASEGEPAIEPAILSTAWQDFVKAGVAWQAFSERNTPSYVVGSFGRAMRFLATCVSMRSGSEPWLTSVDDLQWTLSIAGEAQKSGKLRQLVEGVIRKVVDAKMLFDDGPFSHALVFGEDRATRWARAPEPLASLGARRDAEKLPDAEAFWELADIVFTKEPEGLVDALRFAQIRLLFLCGLRISEAATIPEDWARVKQYVAADGSPAGSVGGISTSLMLRHFAAKQGADENSAALVEAFQYVPTQFEEIVRSTLDTVRTITAPLRDRLRQQASTGRHFPEFGDGALIPLTDAFTRLTGNPLVSGVVPEEAVEDYRCSFATAAMDAINAHQRRSMGSGSVLASGVQIFWSKWQKLPGSPALRSADGTPQPSARSLGLAKLFVRADELEDWVASSTATKMSDTAPLALASGGTIAANELLFLMPKRALIEGRNGGICDLTRYFSVGRVTSEDVIQQLDGRPNGIFARYGDTDRARALSLNTHSLRHAQNTALFSAGLSDAIITKRFNRKSVAQSHVYDHRSLAERLEAVSLPAAAKALPEKVGIVAKMILSGQVKAPIVDGFRRVQREHGDARAFEYLAAEADGFHATPYGHCINGFTQEPCPKHLECFSGCNHFVNTGLDRNAANLAGLLGKLETAVAAIGARPGGPGRDNQLRHAQKHVANLRTLLATPEGMHPFPDGPDLSRPIAPRKLFDA